MKCDKLKAYKGDVYIHAYGSIADSEVYLKADVDATIAELKARIQLDDDEMAGFLDLEEECGGGDLRNYIAELKAKLEDAKATAYAESVDAGMRERRLKRALWLARSRRAFAEAKYCNQIARRYEEHKEKTIAKCYDEELIKWKKVDSKCRAKAEEYR